MTSTPYLSIIVPIRNEERFIAGTLEMLVTQDYAPDRFELIVVDGRSTDGTRSVLERFIREHPGYDIRLLDNPGTLSSRARNIGVRAARGKLIGVIDGHVYIPNGKLFAAMEIAHEQKHALCLARPAPLDVPGLEEGTAYWIAVARKTWLGHSRNSYIYSDQEGFVDPMSSGFAYDRSVFETVGLFDESFDAAEDVEFHYRLKKAGFQAYTSPSLLIYSYPRPSYSSLFRQQTRYGAGRARLVLKHPEAFSRETLIPPLIFVFFGILPLMIAAGFKFHILLFLSIACVVSYWSALIATGLSESLRRGCIFRGMQVALGIWITHIGLGWGFLQATFKSRSGLESSSPGDFGASRVPDRNDRKKYAG